MQTKKGSLIEALVNVAVGFGVSMASNMILLEMYGIRISLNRQFHLTLWFTGISILRSYVLRRTFNRWRKRECALE